MNQQSLKDKDVLAEESMLLANNFTIENYGGCNIVTRNVRKAFKVKKTYVHAVQGVSFVAPVGEIFGLLGINGAGKSTMFKMLAGQMDPIPDPVLGDSIFVQRDRGVGYCPQNDPLWPMLTPREHLKFACYIRGIEPENIPTIVDNLMRAVDLTIYANVQSRKLSGGNKRKLCLAMSFVGTPNILFLDEPSAGVDPYSRRFMWSIIQQVAARDKKSTVVLTTHSMEECEAICTRTAIMVNGVFRCLGPNTHLRKVYGKGFALQVIFVAPENRHEQLMAEWGLPPAAEFVSFFTLRRKVQDGSLHFHLLTSRATCFPTYSEDCEDLENVLCASVVATKWWSAVSRVQTFVSAFTKELSMSESQVIVQEVHEDKCELHVPEGKSLTELFKVLEKLKKAHILDKYTLSHSTLEKIFNAFAHEAVMNVQDRKDAKEIAV